MRLLGVMLACAAVLAAQTVEGTVVNPVTKAGVADADVRLLGKGDNNYAALTDAQGYFHFDNVLNGSYSLDCGKEGFDAYRTKSPVVVKTGADAVKLQVQLRPLGKISGRVVDGKGRPVADARLTLAASPNQRATLTVTGEDGRFSIGNLGSGSYTLMAQAPLEWGAPDPVEGRKLAWLPTYYPSIGFREAAGKIAVNSGTEVTELEIKLLSGPVYHVRGVVLTPGGDAAPDAVVDLDQASHQTGGGAFDFETADGEWQIQARAQDGDTELRAYQTVRVAGHDQDGLKLVLEAPFSIHGRLLFDPPLPTGKYPYPKTVGLGAADRSRWRGSMEPDEGGNFTIDNVYPGVYNVSAPRLFLSGYYLESIRLGSQDALGVEVEFRSGFQPLEVRLKGGGGTVRGNVEDCKGGWIVLVPMDLARRRVELTGWGFCDATGHYEITNVRPGEYYAIAGTEQSQVFVLPQGIPAGQEGAGGYGFGPRLINQATRVSVREGETSLVDLRVVKAAGQ